MKYTKFFRAASATLAIVIVLTVVTAPSAWAGSKYKTLYKFKNGKDGSQPYRAGLIFDAAGNLYGTTLVGGNRCGSSTCGVVFKLAPHSDGSWTESVLYSFTGGTDGWFPQAGLTLDAAGNLYGTTLYGGAYGDGTVFKLTPNLDGTWTESMLYSFCSLTNCADGVQPSASLIFDAAGNLYGTTYYAGANGGGTVFKLTPNPDGSWAESVLYSFCSLTNCADGKWPQASLIFDQAGNLYGTTTYGGADDGSNGTVFKLTPNADGSWTQSVLYAFASRNVLPQGAVVFDGAGNLYGTTALGNQFGCGDVFELTPNPDGSWKLKVLYKFRCGKDGSRPRGGVIFDVVGNLYGTTSGGGAFGSGTVFELVPKSSGRWQETVLHAFADRPGADPEAGQIFDAAGNLYGTTYGDGHTTFGSVFEITP